MPVAANLFETYQESLEAARRDVVALLGATRSTRSDEARFDWLYTKNPDGEAVLWGLRDCATAKLVGFTVGIPRRVLIDAAIRLAWNGADFSMHPNYRTLGPAVKLRRAAKASVDEEQVDFLYAHPNDGMALIHARVGHVAVGRMVRYALPLEAAPYLSDRLGRLSAAALAPVANGFLRLRGRQRRHRNCYDVQLLSPARFDERFNRLFWAAAPACRVVGVRDARYLKWRYAENPLYQTDAVVAEQGDQLRGYLLFSVKEKVAHVKDVFPPNDDAAVRDLLAEMIREGRRRTLQSISFTALESNPVLRHFVDFGFRQRPESSEMYAYARPDAPWREAVLDKNAWYLTVGDRDV